MAAQAGPGTAPETELPAPSGEAWESLIFPKIDQHTAYASTQIDGRKAVRAQSACSASALVYRLDAFELEETPILEWEWRIDRDLKIDSHRNKAGDDFAARVYVMFEFEPESASVWDQIRRKAARAVFGIELPGNALNYVWSTVEERGAVWDNPYTARSKMISLGAGPHEVWRRERVDVLADHRANFGTPPKLMAVALMSDSDNSCQKADAYFAGFRFTGR